MPTFATFFDTIGHERIGFEDFRKNGLLLPAKDNAALRMGLPLHRGPHRDYNEIVIERVSEVADSWQERHRIEQDQAGWASLRELGALQQKLRQELLSPTQSRIRLNRYDPLGSGADFAELDEMAETLWKTT